MSHAEPHLFSLQTITSGAGRVPARADEPGRARRELRFLAEQLGRLPTMLALGAARRARGARPRSAEELARTLGELLPGRPELCRRLGVSAELAGELPQVIAGLQAVRQSAQELAEATGAPPGRGRPSRAPGGAPPIGALDCLGIEPECYLDAAARLRRAREAIGARPEAPDLAGALRLLTAPALDPAAGEALEDLAERACRREALDEVAAAAREVAARAAGTEHALLAHLARVEERARAIVRQDETASAATPPASAAAA